MSQSPERAEASQQQFSTYEQRWLALYELVDEGKSWSGHERNCCFLNTGTGRFADGSSFTGLDFDDDGRALAVCDWDFDGQVDFWVTNRTGPRLRWLHNESTGHQHFVAFRLRGTRSSRDAIGARVTVTVASDPPRPMLRTLRAGDGYLSQSSRWMHFGLGDAETIDSVKIRWPDGSEESWNDVKGDQFYTCTQGTGQIALWSPPKFSLAEQSAQHPADASDSTQQHAQQRSANNAAGLLRTWIVGRIPFPPVAYESEGRKVIVDTSPNGHPQLINLWSVQCVPCVQELNELKRELDQIKSSQLDIVALSVDSLADDPERTSQAVQMMERLELPFATGFVTRELMEVLELMHRSIVELKQPLPVPCSFLIDGEGNLAAIYKGRVTVDELLQDVAELQSTPENRRERALPFAGTWIGRPLLPDPRPFLAALVQARKSELAINYATHYLQHSAAYRPESLQADLYELLGNLFWDNRDYARAAEAFSHLVSLAPDRGATHREIGLRLLNQSLVRESVAHLRLAVRHSPEDVELVMNLALREMEIGETAAAVDHFEAVLKARPNLAIVQFYLGNGLHQLGRVKEAVEYYRAAAQQEPLSPAANNLAWLLATNSDETIRDGKQAVEYAERLAKASQFKDIGTLDTLAASYAETGRFDDAVRTINDALGLSRTSNDGAWTERLEQRLQLYNNAMPLRDSSP